MFREIILVFLLVLAGCEPVFATEAMVIESSANVLGHGVGMRNALIAESGLAAANVKICYTGTGDITGHDASYMVRVVGSWPYACIDYAVANLYEVASVSYDWFTGAEDAVIYGYAGATSTAVVIAATNDPVDERLYYTATPGREYPEDTAGSTDTNLLEFRTYDTGSLSAATARTSGIIAYLIDQQSFNYFDARAAVRENSSNWPNWDRSVGFGYVDITAAKAETNPAVLALQPPLVKSVTVSYGVDSTVTVNFYNFLQTRWDSTKVVYFNSEPAPSAGPADAAGVICDNAVSTATSCAWTAVPDGTYWIAAYTESGANYSSLINGLTTYPVTVDFDRAPANTFVDNTSDNIVQDGLSWETAWVDLDQVKPIAGDSLYIKATKKIYFSSTSSSSSGVSYSVYGDATGVGSDRGNNKAIISRATLLGLHELTWDGVNSVYTHTYISDDGVGAAKGYIEYTSEDSLPLYIPYYSTAALVYAAAAPAWTNNATDGFIIKLGDIANSDINIYVAPVNPGFTFISPSYLTGVRFIFSGSGISMSAGGETSIAENIETWFAGCVDWEPTGVANVEIKNVNSQYFPNNCVYSNSLSSSTGIVNYHNNIIAHGLDAPYSAATLSCFATYSGSSTNHAYTINFNNNTLYDCGDYGFSPRAASGRYLDINTKNNIFWGNGLYDLRYLGSITQVNDHNLYSTYSAYLPGAHDIVGDPLFVSPTDLSLQQNSPVIEAGIGTKFNGLPADRGARQTTRGVVDGGTFFGNYPFGDNKNSVNLQ